MKKKVLVLGNYRQSISVIRSLGRAGYSVAVSRTGADRSMGEFSRYASEAIPCVEVPPEHLLADLKTYLAGQAPGSVTLFPVGENTLETLARMGAEIARLAPIAMPSPEVTLTCLDKRATYALARELDLPLPPMVVGLELEEPEARARWEQQAAAFGFPCIIKRNSSVAPVRGEKALKINDASELARFLDEGDADPATLILQKRIEGFRHNCHFAAIDGKLIAYFQQKVLRTDVHDGSGYGVEGLSLSPNDRMRELTERLVRRLGYTGVGTTQFLMDDVVGRPYFLELNPRLDANTALALSCGMDFPLLAVLCAKHRAGDRKAADAARAAVPKSYIVGRRIAWVIGDFFGWLHAVHHRKVTVAQAAGWLARLAFSPLRNRHHVTWDPTDPGPSLALLGTRLRAVFRSVIGRVVVDDRRPVSLLGAPKRPSERPLAPDHPSPSL